MEFIAADDAAYALGAGLLAAFNPCGFALLPAYLTIIVTGTAEDGVSRPVALRRATTFSLAMTLGFVAVFTGFGLLFAGARAGLQGDILPYLSYVTTALGALLVLLGVHMARGGELNVPGLKFRGRAPRAAFGSQAAYGASFALASMSCTIGPFLVVVTRALDAPNPVATGIPFVVYGAGMGTSILLVSLAAALAGTNVVAGLRRRTPLIMRIAGWLMIVAGSYVLLYGLAEILQSHGILALNTVLTTTGEWQGAVTRTIDGWPLAVRVALVVLAVAAIAGVFMWRRRAAAETRKP